MRVGLLVAAAAVAPGPAQPGVPVAAVVARRPPVAVSPCVPGVVVAKVAAGLVVVAPLERYRGVDFAIMTYQYYLIELSVWFCFCF